MELDRRPILPARQPECLGRRQRPVRQRAFIVSNENWGTRLAHYFDAKTGTLEEQDYTIYRDMRSWTAALTFRALNNQSSGRDLTVAATFSFKAFPRFKPASPGYCQCRQFDWVLIDRGRFNHGFTRMGTGMGMSNRRDRKERRKAAGAEGKTRTMY